MKKYEVIVLTFYCRLPDVLVPYSQYCFMRYTKNLVESQNLAQLTFTKEEKNYI